MLCLFLHSDLPVEEGKLKENFPNGVRLIIAAKTGDSDCLQALFHSLAQMFSDQIFESDLIKMVKQLNPQP